MNKKEYFMATQPIYIHNETEVVYKAIQGFTEIQHHLDDVVLPKGAWQLQIKAVRLPYLIPKEELQSSVTKAKK